MTVYTRLVEMGCSLQSNRKTQEGKQHPDRDGQFHHIARQVEAFQRSKPLLVTADCGGSNGYRNRLWKLKLQEFADETGLTLHVCHFHPVPASGTRLNTVCSVISRRTGEDSH